MRSILAGAVGLSLGLGGLLSPCASRAWAQPQYGTSADAPAVSLGRPVPAASLGHPTTLSPGGDSTFQPAGFRTDRPLAASMAPVDTAPLLAPVLSTPGTEPAPPPRTLASDGGSSATPPPLGGATPGTPTYGPATSYPVYPGNAGALGCGPGGSPYAAGGGCFMGGCCDPGAGGYSNRFYASADFLLMWVPAINTPLPLALRSAVPYTGPNLPPTTVAIGSTDLISTIRIGAQFEGGFWFDPCHLRGLEGSFFFVGPTSRDLSATTSAAFPTLLRPYIVINTPIGGLPAPVAAPGQPNFADIASTVRVHTESFLMGSDVNYRRQLLSTCGTSVDLLLGFRYMHLDESLTITETATIPNPPPAIGVLTDRFRTVNNFYGYQLGLAVHKQWGLWSADLLMKVAAGDTFQTVDVSGTNNVSAARPNVGLFAQDSNIGRYNHNNFSVVPDVGLKLNYQWTPRLQLSIGYSAMYWSNVLQPGNQIDPIVDQTKVPTLPGTPAAFMPLNPADPHPLIPFRRSDYFAHGLTFGVTFKW